MTDAAPVIPPEMKYLELEAEEGILELYGKLITSVDNDRGDRPRWAEIFLYSYVDTNPEHDETLPEDDENYGTYGKKLYLVYTMGHSVVYHRHDSPCNKGFPLPAGEFLDLREEDCAIRAEDPDDLEPCERCRPPRWNKTDPETILDLEVTWYRFYKCRDGDDVLDALRKDPRCKNCTHKAHEYKWCWCSCDDYVEGPRPLSIPGRRLVEKARHLDPEIARVAGRRTRM